MREFLVVLAVCAGTSSRAWADFEYPDFSSVAGLTLRGDAAQADRVLRVMPAGFPGQLRAGAAWYTAAKQRVDVGFETRFSYRVSGGGGGDGLAFILQNESANALGGPAAGMGYDGLRRSVAIEWDTYPNLEIGDPNANHLGVHSRGSAPNSYVETARIGPLLIPPFVVRDGAVHHARVLYRPGTLHVFLEDEQEPSLAVELNLRSIDGADITDARGRMWVGFGAGTGDLDDDHDVLSWSFRTLCAADFNGDGAVDSDDFFDFLNAFFEGDTSADFNGDGTLDSDDFFDFLNAYYLGC